tara:strand:- start:263 stop:661 length:399 start_codon:yes stop_codon:yes gene_type:complete
MSDTGPITSGAHHVGLTVPDVDAAAAFFVDALGFRTVGGNPEYPAIFVSDGTLMVTLWRAESPETATPFDRRGNIGLHHLALRTADLDGLADRLRARSDTRIEFAPEGLGSTGIRHMMCRIPGDIRVEFIAA